MALEILCRLSHYFLQQDMPAFQQLTSDISPALLQALSSAAAIPALLRDMRPLLNTVNTTNPNVFSFPTRCLRVATNWKKVDTERTLQDAPGSYLDLCRDCVCFNLLEQEVLVRFTYQTVQRVHFDAQTHSIQVLCLILLC